MDRLLSLVDGNDVQAVIVAKLDRLTRSVRTCANCWSASSGLTAVSQWEREAIGERTRDALSHKRRNGERVGNVPYGYRLAEDGLHLEADTAEQAVVAGVSELRADHTLRQIAVRLNEQGLRTRRGSAWRLESVARVVNSCPLIQ